MTRTIANCFIVLTSISLAGTATAGTVFDTPLTSPPGVYFGSGNANSNFTVSQDGTTELGLSVIMRFVGPIDPGAGSSTYNVPTGATASPNTGSAWGFTFSVNTQYHGGSDVLGDFDYTLQITDLTTPNAGPSFDPVRAIPDNSGFGPGGKTAGVNLSTEWGAQNSEALSFAGFLPGYDINAHDTYQITLTELSLTGAPIESVSVLANAGAATPEPASFALMGFGLVTLAFAARKRFARAS